MKKTLFTIAMLVCFNAYSGECEVANPSVESVSEYMLKMAESLNEIKIAYIESDNKKEKEDATDLMVSLKGFKSRYNCASDMVGSYRKSKNKHISESSIALSQNYKDLAGITDRMLAEFKSNLDGKNEILPGERADKESDERIEIGKKWRQIIEAIGLGTNAEVEKIDPKTNKVKKFFITKEERDLIVKELKSQFKLPMKKGDKAAIDEAADLYYNFLIKLNFK